MKLGLGTVQFGMPYGISNTSGQTDENSVSRILELAKKNHIQRIDTAPLYGSSEKVLGENLLSCDFFKIITKTPKIQKSFFTKKDVQQVIDTFHQSLDRLQQPRLYGLLVHHASDLLGEGGDYLYEALVALKQEKKVEKIGISIYDKNEIEQILEKYVVDLIQVPINVFDQRLIRNDYLKQLKKMNIEIHARSVFLQGLLLMSINHIPTYFSPILSHIKKYHAFLETQKMTLQQAALGFALGVDEIDFVICGVNNESQLEQLLAVNAPLSRDQFAGFCLTDENYLNPAKWEISS